MATPQKEVFFIKKINLQTLVHVALLIAMEIVLTQFCTIKTPIFRVGFGFVPIAVCGMLYGPVWAGIAGGISDILFAILLSGGTYFPPLTISAVTTGVVFGMFLYRYKEGWSNILFAAMINCFIISLCLSTYWLHLLTGTPYWTLFITRILQNGIMFPIQFMVLRLLQKPVFLYSSMRVSM